MTPESGSSSAAGEVPSVQVRVDGAGLPAGVYYGSVIVTAKESANRAQVVTVFLQVQPPGSNPGALVDPPELVFPTTRGSSPSSQDVSVYNVSADPKSYRSAAVRDRASWRLPHKPAGGSLDPAAPTCVVVQPITNGLPEGEYRGGLTFQFSDGRVQEVGVRTVVGPDVEGKADCTPEPALTSQTA